MRLAMSMESSRHFGVLGALDLAKQLGFRAVELIPHMFGGDHGKQPSLPDDREIAALRAALDERGLRAVVANAVFMPAHDRWPEETRFIPAAFKQLAPRATPEEYTRYLGWLVRAARALDLATINCLTLPFVGPTPEETLACFVDGMRPVLDAARDHGVVVCVEHEAMCALVRFEPGLRALLDAIDHPAFGLTIDVSNLFASGIEPYPRAYETFKPRIKHVHLRGARLAHDGDTPEFRWFELMTDPSQHVTFTTLRDGAVNVHGLLASLARDDYRGVVTLQPLARGAGLAELPKILADDRAFLAAAAEVD